MFRGQDILKIYDDNFNNIGRATREKVHTEGLLHQVAHVWMFQPAGDELYIFFQQRSLKRDLYPGKYDLIQTTHFDPEESYEDGIIHSMDYYLGAKIKREEIVHIGSIRQKIDVGSYHDNALVQTFAIVIKKALFIMPDTEEIIKVKYNEFADFVHGKTDQLAIYALDDTYLKTSVKEDWWIRGDEFGDSVEPYIDSREYLQK